MLAAWAGRLARLVHGDPVIESRDGISCETCTHSRLELDPSTAHHHGLGVSKAIYDPNIIHKHAKNLYRRANMTLILYGICGALIGYGLVELAAEELMIKLETIKKAMMAVLTALLGIYIGRVRSFELLLQAQTALCQVQIELNTRNEPAPSYEPDASA